MVFRLPAVRGALARTARSLVLAAALPATLLVVACDDQNTLAPDMSGTTSVNPTYDSARPSKSAVVLSPAPFSMTARDTVQMSATSNRAGVVVEIPPSSG